MAITDEEAAAAAIDSLEHLSRAQEEAYSEITAILSAGDEDSFIDTHQLFSLYNVLYFNSKLLPHAELSWSPRLTLCAGMCELSKDKETQKWTRIRVKLSEPLLKLRPRSDLLNTLLHECIHAYLFATSNFSHVRDPTGGHGPGFQSLAKAINAHGGYEITEFHTFHDEVDSYRTHIWQCDGRCKSKPPDFGLVKRTMNRAPGKHDLWWEQHEKECGGTFNKIAEPELTKKQIQNLSAKERAGRQKNKIDVWIKKENGSPEKSSTMTRDLDAVPRVSSIQRERQTSLSQFTKRSRSPEREIDVASPVEKVLLIACPICDKSIKDIYINEHLDKAHS
jgi:hypothetical protein